MMQRRPRQHSAAYLTKVRQLPCIVCLDDVHVEAAHLSRPCLRAGKRQRGMGEKASDRWALPLFGKHHREQHATGETRWWRQQGIDPEFAALALWGAWADGEEHEMLEQIIRENGP